MCIATCPFPFYPCSSRDIPRVPLIASAKKKDPVLSPSIPEELSTDVDEDIDGLEEGINSPHILVVKVRF